MLDRRLRVLVINSHPVQYAAPIYRRMAQHPRLDLHVAYCTLRGAEAAHDPEFGATVKWDTPLLDGYSWTEVPNRGSGAEGRNGYVSVAHTLGAASFLMVAGGEAVPALDGRERPRALGSRAGYGYDHSGKPAF